MPFPPDWTDVNQYPDPGLTSPCQFAWEFLRRNPDYQKSYRAFTRRFNSLLKSYPQALKDEKQWNALENDRHAWIYDPPIKKGESLNNWARRVGAAQRTSIFVFYAKPWQLARNPPNPSNDSPNLFWERHPSTVIIVTRSSEEYVLKTGGKVALGFNLALPVPVQIAAAKNFLLRRQAWLREIGRIPKSQSRPDRRERLIVLLRALDAEMADATVPEMGKVLFPGKPNTYPEKLRDHSVRSTLVSAKAMRDGGYAALLTSSRRQLSLSFNREK